MRIAEPGDVTAVFCANDGMALGLLRALRESGRSIPGDISVVGFGDIPEAAHFVPPLAACGRTSASSAAGPGTAR